VFCTVPVGQAIVFCGLPADTVLYYRRRLPHWIPDGAVIFVTWRLADSGPPVRPAILTAENTGRKPRRVEVLDYACTGPRWLRQPRVAQIVENALRYGETARDFYSLYAWVIMPNHVHAVFQPKAALPSTMRWLKGANRPGCQPFPRPHGLTILAGRVVRPLDSLKRGTAGDHCIH